MSVICNGNGTDAEVPSQLNPLPPELNPVPVEQPAHLAAGRDCGQAAVCIHTARRLINQTTLTRFAPSVIDFTDSLR